MKVDTLYAKGRASWPEFSLTHPRFVELVAAARHASHPNVDAAELFLAVGCAANCTQALHVFEATYLAPARAYIGRHADAAMVDDVVQQVRCALLMPAGAQARILRYAGRGQLHGLVRTMVKRVGWRMRKQQTQATPAIDDSVLVHIGQAPSQDDSAQTKLAVVEAWAKLQPDERLLLQLNYVKGLSVRELASVYDIHAASVARRVARARLRFAAHVRDAMAVYDPERAAAPRMGFESHLSLSFLAALIESDAAT